VTDVAKLCLGCRIYNVELKTFLVLLCASSVSSVVKNLFCHEVTKTLGNKFLSKTQIGKIITPKLPLTLESID